jgi:hypothetical protein
MAISSISYSPNYFPNARETTSFALNKQTNSSVRDNASSDKVQKAQLQQEIQTLKDRDQEVKVHEQAHLSAAGGITISGPHFTYTTGPDGQRYATGGDVSIDTSEVPDDPQATLRKAETIRRAAMAPAQPSGQDYSVASKAAAMASKAAIQLLDVIRKPNQLGSQLDIKA